MVTVLPDAEALVISYLENHPSITALVLGRVYGDLPPSPSFPLVRIHRTGGTAGWPHYLDSVRLQVDAYGRTKTEAGQVSRTVHAVLKEMSGSFSRGVVSGVFDSVGEQYLPDPTYSPAKPRWLCEIVVFVHP